MRTADEIKEFLAQKFSLEKKRLKSYGTKTSSFDLAHAIYRHIEALMCESRYRELKRLSKHITRDRNKHGEKKLQYYLMKYLVERLKATKAMAKAIQNVADTNDKNRPWKPKKVKKEKHKKHDKRDKSRR